MARRRAREQTGCSRALLFAHARAAAPTAFGGNHDAR